MRIFVTHILPEHLVSKYGLSFAACNFSRNLISGGAFDKTYSILPTFVKGDVDTFDGLVYSTLRNGIFSRIAPIVENIQLFQKIPHDSSIWYYNCTILNVTLILLLKLLKPRVKQQVIILDYTPSKNLFNRFLLWVSNHVDGTVCLAHSPLFTCKNSVCLPGVIPMNAPQYPTIKEIKTEFLISGALGDNIAMLPMLLEVFAELPHFTLHITGNAPDRELVERYATKHKNIIYHGMVSYDKYLTILHDTPFLLSTRNPEAPENQCNFPSKIIEGLLHNRIILSTLHYAQISGIKYFKVGCDKVSLKKCLCEIADMPSSLLLLYANQADEVKNRFNSDVWKECFVKIESKL